MSESSLWVYLQRGMTRHWHASRHEETTPGIPDVSYALNRTGAGWIELKTLPDWPKKSKTAVAIKHLTPFQRRWMHERGQRGVPCWLFLRVDKEYLLFSWSVLPLIGKTTRDELYTMSVARWKNRVDWDEFERALFNASRHAS